MLIIGETCANTTWAFEGYVSSVFCCKTTFHRICWWVNMWQSATSCPFLSHPLLSDGDWSSSPPCYFKLHPGVCVLVQWSGITHSLTLDSVTDAVRTKISIQILEKCLLVIWCEALGWCGAAPQIKSPISQLTVMRAFIIRSKLKPQRPLVWNTVQCWMFIAH